MQAMNDSDIIDALGGTAAVARLFDIKAPSVSEWRVNGIPKARRQYLLLLRPDLFIAKAPDDPARNQGAGGEGQETAQTDGNQIPPLKQAA